MDILTVREATRFAADFTRSGKVSKSSLAHACTVCQLH